MSSSLPVARRLIVAGVAVLGAVVPRDAQAEGLNGMATLALMGLIYPMALCGPVLGGVLVWWASKRQLGTSSERVALGVVSIFVPALAVGFGSLLLGLSQGAGALLFFAGFTVMVVAYVALAVRWLRSTTARA